MCLQVNQGNEEENDENDEDDGKPELTLYMKFYHLLQILITD